MSNAPRTAPLIELTPQTVELLADRLYSLGISDISTVDRYDRATLVTASRALIPLP
jgi:hypothetical protein